MHRKTDVADTALAANNFSILATALSAAGLTGILKGDGPFTVFAPTDAPFAKVPQQTLDELLQPENKKVGCNSRLSRRARKGYVNEVIASGSATTLQGQKVNISQNDGVKVNETKMIVTDVEATNGVIHILDSVLMPSLNARG